MRGFTRWFAGGIFAALLGATLAPFWEPSLQEYLQQQGYYEDAPGWWLRQLTWLLSISSEPWFLWSTGAAFGFFIGAWLDLVLKKREGKHGSGIASMIPSLESALKDIHAHAGWIGSEHIVLEAVSVINVRISDFVSESNTTQLLRSTQAMSQTISQNEQISKDYEMSASLKNLIRQNCVILLENINRKPSARDKACAGFIKTRAEAARQGRLSTGAETPQ